MVEPVGVTAQHGKGLRIAGDSRLDQGANFDFLMKKYDPENPMNKKITEWITLDQFPDKIKTELADLKIGGHSGAYQITDGWIVFYVKDKKQGRLKSLQEVDIDLRKVMFQKKFNELLDKNINILKENSQIIYYDDVINEYFGD